MTNPGSPGDVVTVTIDDLEVRGIEIGHALRTEHPVAWLDALDGWFVSDRELVEAVLRDSDRFSSDSPEFKPRLVFGETMLNLDGDAHTRHRCPFDPGFRLRTVRDRYRSHIERTADLLLGGLESRATCDLGKDYASRLAVSVVTAALGLDLPIDEVRSVYDMLAAAIADYRNDEATMVAAREARVLFAEALETELARAWTTGAGLLGDMLGRGPDLTDEELLGNALVIMFGGIETVESTIVNTTWCLLTHRDQLAYTRGEAAWQAAVDEALRFAPPLGFLGRICIRDTTLGGVPIAQGSQVFVNLLAANRDPGLVDDPDEYRVSRGRAGQYLSFSQGDHFCLGYNLARLEGAIGVQKLFDAFPDLNPAGEAPPLAGFSLIRPAGGLQLRLREARA